MKKLFFVSLSLIFGAVLFVAVLRQVGWQEIWGALTMLSAGQLFLVLITASVSVFLAIFRWQIILKSQNRARVPRGAVWRAKLVGFSLSYLTPAVYFGGEPLRALMLKEEGGVDWDKNISSIVIDKALELTVNGLVVVVGIVYLFIYFYSVLPFWLGFILAAILIFALSTGYFFYSRAISQKGVFTTLIGFFWLNRIKKIKGMAGDIQKIEQKIAEFFSSQSKFLTVSVILSLISRFFSILSAWLIIIFLGVEVSLMQLIGFIALTAAIYFLPIPGGLGVHEASQAAIFSVFGLGDHIGTAFSLILRAFFLLVSVIGLIILIHFQIKRWLGAGSRFFNGIGRKLDDSF